MLKQFFCKHEKFTFVRNIYGEEINLYSNGSPIIRSIWECKKCKKKKFVNRTITQSEIREDKIKDILDVS